MFEKPCAVRYPWDWIWLEANHPITGREWNHVYRKTFRILLAPVSFLRFFMLAARPCCFWGLLPDFSLSVDCFTYLGAPRLSNLRGYCRIQETACGSFPLFWLSSRFMDTPTNSQGLWHSPQFSKLGQPCLTLLGHTDLKTVATHPLGLCEVLLWDASTFKTKTPM